MIPGRRTLLRQSGDAAALQVHALVVQAGQHDQDSPAAPPGLPVRTWSDTVHTSTVGTEIGPVRALPCTPHAECMCQAELRADAVCVCAVSALALMQIQDHVQLQYTLHAWAAACSCFRHIWQRVRKS